MENEFDKKMENLKSPETENIKHQEVYKMVLTNARKSSRIGIVFIIIPLLFVLIASVKILFFMRIDYSATADEIIANISNLGPLKWILPMVFIALPVLAIFINLLAISHFYVDKAKKELIISVRYKLKNIIVLIISTLIIISFMLFVIFAYIHFK